MNNLLNLFFNREACTSTPIAKEQVSEIALSIARFIDACTSDQIRLAPDKCALTVTASFRLKFSVLCITKFCNCDLILQLYLFVKGLKTRLCCLKHLSEEWLRC